jgi:predicted MFS family arabinose efflux permease
VAPLVTTIVSRIFGVTHFNMLFGLSFLSHQLGSFCGAWLGGLVFDLTGAYTWGWGALIAIGALAFALQWTMDDRPAPQTRAPRPAAAAA